MIMVADINRVSLRRFLSILLMGLSLVSHRIGAETKKSEARPNKTRLWESSNPEGISFRYPACWTEGAEGESLHLIEFSVIGLLSSESCSPNQKSGKISITIPNGDTGFGLLVEKDVLAEKGTKVKLNDKITLYKNSLFKSGTMARADWAAHVQCYGRFLRTVFRVDNPEGELADGTSIKEKPPKFFVDFLKSIKCTGSPKWQRAQLK